MPPTPDDFRDALVRALGRSPHQQQPNPFLALARQVSPLETTKLSPDQERRFRQWTVQRGITDADEPDAHYDYRGFWLNGGQQASSNGHYPDTYKQHGHPTFSVESRYSLGPRDGGSWNGEQFKAPVRQDSLDTMAALRLLLAKGKAR